MFMPMLAPAAGTLRWRLPEGSILAPGDLIATLDLTDPGAVTQAVPFTGARCTLHAAEVSQPQRAGVHQSVYVPAHSNRCTTAKQEQSQNNSLSNLPLCAVYRFKCA